MLQTNTYANTKQRPSGSVGTKQHNMIDEGRIEIDPDLAQFVLDEHAYNGQRRMDDFQINYLAAIMEADDWKPGSQIAFARLPDGTRQLVNGYHRMHAVIKAGLSQEFQILVVSCEDQQEIDEFYSSFDTAVKLRSTAQLLSARNVAETREVSRSMSRAMMDACVVLENELRIKRVTMTPEQRSISARLKLAEDWWHYARQVEALYKPAGSAALRRALYKGGVVAVALATLKHQPEMAERFWSGVALDSGLVRGDPRHTLVRSLVERNLTDSAEMRIIVPCTAWNAWFEKRHLTRINVMPNSVPRLLGTPYLNR